jgi:hypothetical protein
MGVQRMIMTTMVAKQRFKIRSQEWAKRRYLGRMESRPARPARRGVAELPVDARRVGPVAEFLEDG